MSFVYWMILLCASVLIALTVGLLSAWKKRKGISKDHAELIVTRRYPQSRVIGTRFTKEGSRWVWELDVRYKSELYRVSVDARTATVIRATGFRAAQAYPRPSSAMLGKRIA